ncbi:MAG: PleD family two-component system response regulator [Candidatus Methylomirabilia bacterium]
MKILVVDDDPYMRELVDYNLRLEGYDVLLAPSGSDGISMAQEQAPDLILMDMMMPELDGLQALSILKRHPATSHIPVFMLTARQRMGDLEQAFLLGADDYITKPFDPVGLGRQVAQKLNKAADRTTERS